MNCAVLFHLDGQLFTWGENTSGQLGLGKGEPSKLFPQPLKSLAGIPLAKITAGGDHSFALSLSGAVFGWGKNKAGQLGLNDSQGTTVWFDGKQMPPFNRMNAQNFIFFTHSVVFYRVKEIHCWFHHYDYRDVLNMYIQQTKRCLARFSSSLSSATRDLCCIFVRPGCPMPHQVSEVSKSRSHQLWG